jgi:hypothetical protein
MLDRAIAEDVAAKLFYRLFRQLLLSTEPSSFF